MPALQKQLLDCFQEAWFFLGAARLREVALPVSQSSLAYPYSHTSVVPLRKETWKRFKEGNKEDQRTSLQTASAQAVTQ